jgi:uncharacterized protein YaeQ
MTTLIRHAILLNRSTHHADGGIIFKKDYDEDMPHAYRERITLSPEIWEDMGKPDEVTVTVVPGDTLNG